eukprot:CAMPEP_0185844292 /NCGR_PEP_ID=MMETSP1354-20130828/505_1 /TAXON_ID=708628 /ORGANISM="Erythrolobus madagascarensis, Strain CCMP3276" /LENGTH=670 /DNA_ID=CAMNT_0028543929 /DNA_START=575 /DNA_END=2587 /DNA_ORIENTATION=+
MVDRSERAYRASEKFKESTAVDSCGNSDLDKAAYVLGRCDAASDVVSALDTISVDDKSIPDADKPLTAKERERFYVSGGCTLVVHAMSKLIDSEEVQVASLRALWSALKESSRVQGLMESCGGIHAVLDAMREWRSSEAVLVPALGAIRFAAFVMSNRTLMIEMGLIKFFAEILASHSRSAKVLGAAWPAVSNVSFKNPDAKTSVGEAGLLELMLRSVDRASGAGVDCDQAQFETYVPEVLSGIREVSFGSVANQNEIGKLNGVGMILDLVRSCENNPKLVDSGLLTLANVLHGHTSNVVAFAELGGLSWSIAQLDRACRDMPCDQQPLVSAAGPDGNSSSVNADGVINNSSNSRNNSSNDVAAAQIPWSLVDNSLLVLASAARICLNYESSIVEKMVKEGAVEKAARVLRVPKVEPKILQNSLVLLSALSELVLGKEHALTAALPETLLDVLKSYMNEPAIVRAGLATLLVVVSGEDAAKSRAIASGAMETTMKIASKYQTDANVVLKCCALLAVLVDGIKGLGSSMEKELIAKVLDFMSTYPDDARIQEHCCGILYKIVIWGSSSGADFADRKVRKMVETARDRHRGNLSVESSANQFLTLVISDSGSREGRSAKGGSSRTRSRSRTVGSRSRSRNEFRSVSPPRARTRRPPTMAMPGIEEENEAAGD